MRRLRGGLSQIVFFPVGRIAAAASAVRCLQHFLAVKPEADTNDYTDGNKGFTSICSLIFCCLIFNEADPTLPRHRPCPSIVSRRLPGRLLLSSIFLRAPGYLTHVLVRPQNAKNRPFHVPIPSSETQRYVFMWCVKGRAFGRASHGGCRNVPEIIGSRATRWISERLVFQPKDERFCKQIMSVRCDKKESPRGHGLGWVDV